MKRNKSKVVALLLTTAMLLTSFTACGSKNQEGDSNGNAAAGSEAGKETLTIALQTNSFITDYEENYLTKKLEEDLGIDIEFQFLSADAEEAKTQIALMVASKQNMPDVICSGTLTPESILEYGSKGVFIPLNDWINDPEKAPNFNAIQSEEDKASMLRASTSADGNIYSLTIFEPQTWNMTPFRMFINNKWLEKLNLSMPTTTDEYYEVLKAFAENDPNGNGTKDEIAAYGFSAGTYGENITIPLMNSFIYYPASTVTNAVLTLDDDGQTVIAPFIQEGWKEGLIYMNKLCAEGLLPASVFTDDKTQFMSVLNNEGSNLVGSLSTGSLSRWNDFDKNINGQEYEMLKPLQGPNGIAYSPYMEYNPSPIWFITASCENPELALKLGDLFYSSDISNITRYGEEGVDWSKDETELLNPLYSNAYIEAGIYEKPSLLVIDDIWSKNNNKFWRDINPRYASADDGNTWAYAKEYDSTLKSSYFYADNYNYNYEAHPEKILPSLIYTSEEAQSQSEAIVNISTYVSQSMAQFITGARPISEWDTYVSDLQNMGLDTWLANAQAAYDREQK
ncbi:type 2 periplasmic-binding domain-containing protein [Konateibacter massiliensis]|uniref:extracellular solute-binding protein n=1 Tax=Konateibacter massiliensis TaxID=2002841 RepID=UPI000C14D8C4|nr:extracellular solute-binding protein [Konateibacter massiliensis]